MSVDEPGFGIRAASCFDGLYLARFYTIAISFMIGSLSSLDAASATRDSNR